MLATLGVALLSVLVIMAVVGMAPAVLLVLASFLVAHFCLPDVSGWAVAAAMVAGYYAVGVALMMFQAVRDRTVHSRA